jgi:molybdopterin-guanine dinucleotide biosynthesis protein B
MPPVLCVVGREGVGKTALIEGLVRELRGRGHRIATIARSPEGPVLDCVARDADRYVSAGSEMLVVDTPDSVIRIERTDEEIPLDELVWQVGEEYDLIVAEGFRETGFPKIELHRPQEGALLCRKDELLGVASEEHLDVDVQRFGLTDFAAMAEAVELKLLPSILSEDAIVYVDGVRVPLALFVRKIIAGAVSGMVSSLKGVDAPKSIRVMVKLRRPKP